jgi:hypothetical protein
VVANFEVINALTNSDNDAGAFMANDGGKISEREVILAVVVIRVAQTSSLKFNENFTTLWSANFKFFYSPWARKFAENCGTNLFGVFTHE